MLEGVDLKVLMTTAAGWAPQSLRNPGYIESAQRMPTVLDVIPMGNTSQAAVVYMVESTFTNNAAERAEGANNAGEAALALTPTTATVRQIAVWIPVTAEQMADVAYVQGYVNNRLSLMIRQRLSSEILVGRRCAQPRGHHRYGECADPGKGRRYADPRCRVQGHDAGPCDRARGASATIWHPNDWQDVRLLRTVDGVYIWGSPPMLAPNASGACR